MLIRYRTLPRNPWRRLALFAVLLAVVTTACGNDVPVGDQSLEYDPALFDPTETGEPLPDGYRESFPRDAIAPVYDPSFVAASEVTWPEENLVIGVDLEGEARAYPVGFLVFREIVNDVHRGIPTMVTW